MELIAFNFQTLGMNFSIQNNLANFRDFDELNKI